MNEKTRHFLFKNRLLVIIAAGVVIVFAAAWISMLAEGCILGPHAAYIGQAVDEEQALAKLAGNIDRINRDQLDPKAVPISALAFNETKVTKVENYRAKAGNLTVILNGFVFNVAHKENSKIVLRDDGYLLADNGTLYKLKRYYC